MKHSAPSHRLSDAASQGVVGMNVDLKNLCSTVSGCVLVGDPKAQVERVHMDSRSVQSGDLFLALKGARFDAHDFLGDIALVPGVTALVSKSAVQKLKDLKINGIGVDNTHKALGELARRWRSQFDLPLIAVTGSNGKTTVTQMIASILKAHAGEDSLATEGNLNNDIGVPQTLLRLRAHHVCAVVELGMNHPGEIAYLANIAQANVALVNNAQREHQEFMSSVRAVAEENGQALRALGEDAVAVFPADDEFTQLWLQMAQGRQVITFTTGEVFAQPKEPTIGAIKESLQNNQQTLSAVGTRLSEVRLLSASFAAGVWSLEVKTPKGLLAFNLRIAGEHNVKNALAAVACSMALNIAPDTIARGLQSFTAVQGRSRTLELTGLCSHETVHLIDDTYNANPDSVIAAIDVLASMASPKMLILGDMGEVGEQGPKYHQEIGEYAAKRGVDFVFGLGELTHQSVEVFNETYVKKQDPRSKVISNWNTNLKLAGIHFDSMQALQEYLKEFLISGLDQKKPCVQSILVKGSRFMKMEQCVQSLETLSEKLQMQHAAHKKESTCC